VKAGASIYKACEELEISIRTYQRWTEGEGVKEDQRPHATRPEPANKILPAEVDLLLSIINLPGYMSLPPSQIIPSLADKGIYIMSESSLYRYMRAHNMQHHRGRSKARSSTPKSTHSATGPNQVWMWDITYIPGPIKGMHYYLYMMIDLFSRKIVGWEIWPEESADHASQLILRATLAENVKRDDMLVLHSDNGSPMKGSTMLTMLQNLGIIPSRSRPRVSNDNPYAESIFRTCKYRPNYPSDGFLSINTARAWVKEFTEWYNNEHRHSGLNFLTPSQRHNGHSEEVFANRRCVYEEAKDKHPERWSRSTRNWSLDDEVWLNPETKSDKEGKKVAI
jgi:putative transposase